MITETANHATTGTGALPLHRRKLIILSVMLSLLISLGAAWQSRVPITSGKGDFKYLYASGKIVLSGQGAKLYEPGMLFGIVNAHGPYEALLFIPIASLPFAWAVWVWWALNLVFAFASLYLLLPMVPRIRAAHLEFAILSLGIFFPLLIAEIVGQDTALTFFLFTICLRNLAGRRFWMAGTVLALAMYKPNLALPFLALVALTSPGSMLILAAFTVTCALLLALSIAVLGASTVFAYPQSMLHFLGSRSDSAVSDMPNIRGLADWIFQPHLSKPTIFLLIALTSALVIAVSVWSVHKGNGRRDEQNQPLGLALFMLATLLVGYHDYAYDLTLMLLPVFLIWNWSGKSRAQTLRHKLLNYSGPTLICCSALIAFMPQLYTCAIVFLFILICWELQASEKERRFESDDVIPARA